MIAEQEPSTPSPRWETRWNARSDGDLEALRAALESETLSGESPVVRRYEAALAAHFGSSHCVAVSSGTAAIHLALLSLGATRGSEVLVPAVAPLPSLLPVLAAGATPVVVDTCRNHLGFDPGDLARKLTPRTRAALAVELWGYPQNLAPALEILNQRGVPLVEDACQAHGTVMGGLPAGRGGRAGCFSTHNFKFLSTGEGGFVLTDDPATAAFIDRFARLGGLDGHHRGVNYKLSGLAAALGMNRLKELPARLERQRANARLLLEGLSTSPLRELPAASLGRPNYYSLVLLLDAPLSRIAEMTARLSEYGLYTDKLQFGYDIVYRRPMFAELATPCPNAEWLVDHAIQIPCHPGLSPSDLSMMTHVISEAARRASGS